MSHAENSTSGHMPKRGDKFIHMRILTADARPADVRADPGREAWYQVREVTCVRHYEQGNTDIFHREAGTTGSADRRFSADQAAEHVRRWI